MGIWDFFFVTFKHWLVHWFKITNYLVGAPDNVWQSVIFVVLIAAVYTDDNVLYIQISFIQV